MSQIKGPALFLAQFFQDVPPYNTLENITAWTKEQVTKAVESSNRGSIWVDM
jgi:hypothetical protein